MKIEALCSIGSGRYDKGDIFTVSDKEGEALIKAGAAQKAASASKPSEERSVKKIVDVQASNEGRASKRIEAEETVAKRKEKNNGK